ncbi:hypothetical protein ACS127_10330 [Amphibacillus sp. Q70]|uniref:hypothetical protein n=1 Tax=Amphibacillus sp. Q70 TaxID=3453416 RepID=UPI003F83E15C
MKKEELPNKLERHYIECPNCKQQYTSYFINDDIKALQKEIETLNKKGVLKVKQKNKLTKLKRKLIFMNNQLKMKFDHG